MTRANLVVVCSMVVGTSGLLHAQDAAKVDAAHYKVLVDNASVRVLEISYPAGAASVMHQHPESIAVALTPMKVEFTLADGKKQADSMDKDSARYTPAGSHNPHNVGSAPMRAILVEFKGAAPGKATLPASRPGMQMKTLAEGPRGSAILATAAPTFSEPAGAKHDFDQVVIALDPSAMSLSVDGKPARTTWKRGDVQFIGRGVAHDSRNAGDKPVDMVIVAIK